jgi:cell division protein FtsB
MGEELTIARMTLDGVTLLALGLVSYLTMSIRASIADIRLEQANVKEALVNQQTATKDKLQTDQVALRSEFTDKVAQIAQTMAVHAAEDHLNFASIRESLSGLVAVSQVHNAQKTSDTVLFESFKEQLTGIKSILDSRTAVVSPKSKSSKKV